MSSPATPVDEEPVNERNWYDKMIAAQLAYRHRREHWRTHFTRQELDFIDRAVAAEMQWVVKAVKHDLPGPRRFDFIDD